MRLFNCLIVLALMPFAVVSQDLHCNDLLHYGEGTFYGGVAGGQGNCGLDVPVGDTMHVAMNHADYDSSNACGACLRVIGPKGIVHLRVVDRCPECKPGDLDMTPQAFFTLAQERDGRIPLSWQYEPCPVKETIRIKFKVGSSAFWTAVQVRNSRYAIARLEYRHADGSYEDVPRTMYNFFLKESGMDDVKSYHPGPYHFRITAVSGQVLELPDVPFDTVQEVVTGVQFAEQLCPDCNGDTLGGALVDNCGVCSGGNTGIAPNSSCKPDCNGYWEGSAYTDGCGRCVAGTTGATPCDADCHGTLGGSAYIDNCGNCVGGFTKLQPCKKDCANVWGGSAGTADACGRCSGGTTGLPVCTAQRIFLTAGWNLISINVVPNEISVGTGKNDKFCISTLFSGLDVQEIKTMDAFWRTDQSDFLNTLQMVKAGEGYLVKMNSAGTLTVIGVPVESPNSAPLQQGWQLFGCPYQTAMPMAGVLGRNFSVVKDFDGFNIPNNTQSNIDSFEPGKGYFVKK